jgi:type IV secretory pathway VirJ component
MKLKFTSFLLVISCLCYANQNDSLHFGIFGKVKIYHPVNVAQQLVLLVSGDDGWNKELVELSTVLSDAYTMVIGINYKTYSKNLQKTKGKCDYPAGDFEELSKSVQKKYHFKHYINPVLIGYTAGAALVYVILAQAPAHTFKGAMAINYCPKMEWPRQFCKGFDLKMHVLKVGRSFYLEPSAMIQEPFIVLNDDKTKKCDNTSLSEYLKEIPNSEIKQLPQAKSQGKESGMYRATTIKEAFIKMTSLQTAINSKPKNDEKRIDFTQIRELPYHVIGSESNPPKPMVFFISGDGGFTSFDQLLCTEIALQGNPVVALDALKYFWESKTPEETAVDVERLITYYRQVWKTDKVILVGYSFGADVMPFILSRLPKNTQKQVKLLALLSPSLHADFEIHVTDMLSLPNSEDIFNTAAELKKNNFTKTLCIYGSDETEEIKGKVDNSAVTFKTIGGGHHFSNDFKGLTKAIADSQEN